LTTLDLFFLIFLCFLLIRGEVGRLWSWCWFDGPVYPATWHSLVYLCFLNLDSAKGWWCELTFRLDTLTDIPHASILMLVEFTGQLYSKSGCSRDEIRVAATLNCLLLVEGRCILSFKAGDNSEFGFSSIKYEGVWNIKLWAYLNDLIAVLGIIFLLVIHNIISTIS